MTDLFPPSYEDWVEVEVTQAELEEEAASGRWHGIVAMDYVLTHLLGQRGIRVFATTSIGERGMEGAIKPPYLLVQCPDTHRIVVRQGPGPLLC